MKLFSKNFNPCDHNTLQRRQMDDLPRQYCALHSTVRYKLIKEVAQTNNYATLSIHILKCTAVVIVIRYILQITDKYSTAKRKCVCK